MHIKTLTLIVCLSFLVVFIGKTTGMVLKNIFPKQDISRNLKNREKAASLTPLQVQPKKVFIDSRKIYWGNLGELTKPESYFARQSPLRTTNSENSFRKEALRELTQELRAALKAFSQQHDVKIVWQKEDLTIPDLTAQFIKFWDEDYNHLKEREGGGKTDMGGKGR